MVAHDLRDTLQDFQDRHDWGRAIAAPQIGAPIRMIIIDIERPMLLCNPEITDVGYEDLLVWDDCFSFPDMMVQVQRAHKIKVRYLDERGETQSIEAEGPLAELLQHEIDHLDGVLAVDRASGLDPFCLKEEWKRHYGHEGRYGQTFQRSEPALSGAD